MNSIARSNLVALSIAKSAALAASLDRAVTILENFEDTTEPDAIDAARREWASRNSFPNEEPGAAPSVAASRCLDALGERAADAFFAALHAGLIARRKALVARVESFDAALAAEDRWRQVLAA